jgi:hypothetical protein
MYTRFNTKMIVMISKDEKCCVFSYFVKQYTRTLLFIIFSKSWHMFCSLELMIYHESKTRCAWKQIRFALNVFTSSMETFKQPTIIVKLPCGKGSPRATPWENTHSISLALVILYLPKSLQICETNFFGLWSFNVAHSTTLFLKI